MTRELSPLFHMGDEVIPDLAVAELVRWGASWQGAAKALAAGESKMVRALRDIKSKMVRALRDKCHLLRRRIGFLRPVPS